MTPSPPSRSAGGRSTCATARESGRRGKASSPSCARGSCPRPWSSRASPASPAAPSATSPTTRRVSSSAFPTVTTRGRGSWRRSRFTETSWPSTTCASGSSSSRSPSPPAAPRSTAPSRSSTASRRTSAGSGAPPAPGGPSLPPPSSSRGETPSGRRCCGRRSTSRPATSSRSCCRASTRVDCAADPFDVYRALRMVNPSPYMYFLKTADIADRRLLAGDAGAGRGAQVETRPIAGTRPRGRTRRGGRGARPGAPADEKERAEHVMLVDLGRNDLGRVCRFGERRVPEFMKVERYCHVVHIVSSRRGRASRRAGTPSTRWPRRSRPARSAARRRCARWRSSTSWSPSRRGPYGGALGYFDLRGNLDFCIAIRTLLLRGGQAPRCRRGRGSWPTPTPPPRTGDAEPRRSALRGAVASSRGRTDA